MRLRQGKDVPPRFVRAAVSTGLLLLLIGSAAASDGDLDPSFGDNGVVQIEPADTQTLDLSSPVVQGDGKIIVCGTSVSIYQWKYAGFVARFNAAGSPDASFGQGGRIDLGNLFVNPGCAGTVLQHDGKIVLNTFSDVDGPGVPVEFDVQIARLNSDGSKDMDFGYAGVSHMDFMFGDYDGQAPMVIQPDGAIVIGLAASPNSLGIARVRADGSNDSSFGVDGRVTIEFPPAGNLISGVHGILIDAQGRIVVAGYVATGGAVGSNIADFAAARVLSDGTLDASFGDGGRVIVHFDGRSSFAEVALLQDDGGIVLAGAASYPDASNVGDPNYDVAVARLRADGSLDASFGDGGRKVIPLDFVENGFDFAYSGVIRPDGKIELVGQANAEDQFSKGFVMQLDEHGNPVDSFGLHGVRLPDIVTGQQIAERFSGIVRDGSSYLVAGLATSPAPEYANANFLMRLEAPAQLLRGHSMHARPPR